MKAAVIVFPGSNCDRDIWDAINLSLGGFATPKYVWHADSELPSDLDLIALPGGFSYGDYLRSGAMSAKSPIMREVIKAAEKGVNIIGVCNGFQVLTESGILPGTLMRNRDLNFICKDVHLKVANNNSNFTNGYNKEQVIRVPVAHHDGNYFASEDVINSLEDNEQVAFRYCNPEGDIVSAANPNGSLNNIAGIFNKGKNVLGMMPHPERVVDSLNGGVDGKILFDSLVKNFK